MIVDKKLIHTLLTGIKNHLKECIFLLFVFGSFIAWLIDIYINGSESSQISIFFSRMNDFLADLTNTTGYCAENDPYNNLAYVGWEHKQYPPLSYIFYGLISKFAFNMDQYYENNSFHIMYYEPLFLTLVILIYSFLFILMFELIKSYKQGNIIIKYSTATALLLSYPILFTLERGNNYLIAIIFLIIFIFNYNSNSVVYREIALLALGLSFSIKLTPAVFGILLLHQKRWGDAIRAAIYGLILFFVPFLFLNGGIANFSYFLRNLQISAAGHSPFEGISLLGSISYLASVFGIQDLSVCSSKLIYINYITCILLLCFSFIYKHHWQKILAIGIASISVSGQANEYCSLIFIPFIILFLDETPNNYNTFLVLICIMMISGAYQSSFCLWNIHCAILILTLLMLIVGLIDTITNIMSLKNKNLFK